MPRLARASLACITTKRAFRGILLPDGTYTIDSVCIYQNGIAAALGCRAANPAEALTITVAAPRLPNPLKSARPYAGCPNLGLGGQPTFGSERTTLSMVAWVAGRFTDRDHDDR